MTLDSFPCCSVFHLLGEMRDTETPFLSVGWDPPRLPIPHTHTQPRVSQAKCHLVWLRPQACPTVRLRAGSAVRPNGGMCGPEVGCCEDSLQEAGGMGQGGVCAEADGGQYCGGSFGKSCGASQPTECQASPFPGGSLGRWGRR